MELTVGDFDYLGSCLEGFFYGLYSGIFAMYLQYHVSDKGTDNKKNILFFAICALYVSYLAAVVLDTTSFVLSITSTTMPMVELFHRLDVTRTTINSCCDLLSQSILIYRCWIVWGRNIRVVIIPSILALTFLALWLASTGAEYILQGKLKFVEWEDTVVVIGLAMSMTVNALVTGLIVLKIFKVFREVKATITPDEQTLGTTGGGKLRTIIFILIESGMALLSIQLARLVVTILLMNEAATNAFEIIVPIHEMFNGITPTIILVRVSMGLSFHDEASMVEAANSICFAPNDPNSISGMGSIGSVHEETRDDGIDVQPTISRW